MVKKATCRLRSRTGLLCIASAAAVIGFGAPAGAFAQQVVAQNTSAASAEPALEEVIVTATKRSTNLQDTPISITAVTGQDLLDRGIGDFTELAQEIPGVSMKTSGPGQTEYEMRGLSSNGGSSPTVGFYLDDVPMTPPALGFIGKNVIDPNLYDLNRIEVLRGPQGTLYGSGSMGGTIKLLTNQPDSTGYHASAETILSGTDGGGFNHTENAMVNLPLITDQLAIRIVGTESYTSGWINRIVLNPFPLETDGGLNRGNILGAPVQADFKDVNSTQLVGGRITALYTPTDRLTISAMLFDQRITQDGESNFDSDPGTLAHYEPFNIPEPYSDNFTLWSVNANYKFDSFDVTSVSSHWNRSAAKTQDESEVLYALFGFPGPTVADGGVGPASITENDKTAQFSEELRVASSGDGRLQWLVGLFYSSFTSDLNYYSYVNGLVPAGFGTNDLIVDEQPSTVKQKAAFGELTYKVMEGLKATAGLRYFEYDSTTQTAESGVLTSGGPNYLYFNAAAQDHGIDPKFNLSYDVNKDLMVYGTAERGFRPGGGNNPVTTSGATGAACLADLQALGQTTSSVASFKPDNVWSYELGEKYKIGSTVTLDGAIYHERWTGVQQEVGLPSPCGFVYFANFGTAVVNGGELEAKALLTSHWQVSGNFSYSHSYFVDTNAATGTVEGQTMQDIPLMTSSGALTYLFRVKAGWQASVRGSYDWTDGLSEPVGLDPSGKLPAHGFANLRATMFNDHWTLAAFATNLTNKHAEMEVDPTISAPIPAYFRAVSNQPLTVGIDVNVKF
jgi:outer membrane receptor protein involved in Fe transport